MLGKIGIVVDGLILVDLKVGVLKKSPKLRLYALVSAVVGVLCTIVGSSQLNNEPTSPKFGNC